MWVGWSSHEWLMLCDHPKVNNIILYYIMISYTFYFHLIWFQNTYLCVAIYSFDINEVNEIKNITLELMSYILILIFLYIIFYFSDMNDLNEITIWLLSSCFAFWYWFTYMLVSIFLLSINHMKNMTLEFVLHHNPHAIWFFFYAMYIIVAYWVFVSHLVVI